MSANCLLEDRQKIVFFGDGITEPENGYAGIVQNIIGALRPNLLLTYVNAGIGGNRSNDMLERIGDDVIVHDPDWITISMGINDVWYGVNGNSIDKFKDYYFETVDRLLKQTVAKLALFTTTVIGEDLNSEANTKLIPYNNFIRETARRKKCLLVPMDEVFHQAIKEWHEIGDDLRFTIDGVHMSPIGDYLMAHTLAKAWGVI